jgi:hypothetical protein
MACLSQPSSETSNTSRNNGNNLSIDLCRTKLQGIRLRLRLLQVKRKLTDEQLQDDADALELLIEESDLKVRVQELSDAQVPDGVEASNSTTPHTASNHEPQQTSNGNTVPPEYNLAGYANPRTQAAIQVNDQYRRRPLGLFIDITADHLQRDDGPNPVANGSELLQLGMPETSVNDPLVNFPNYSFAMGLNDLRLHDGSNTSSTSFSVSQGHTPRAQEKSNTPTGFGATANESTFWNFDAMLNGTSSHHEPIVFAAIDTTDRNYASILNSDEPSAAQIDPHDRLTDLGFPPAQITEEADAIGFGDHLEVFQRASHAGVTDGLPDNSTTPSSLVNISHDTVPHVIDQLQARQVENKPELSTQLRTLKPKPHVGGPISEMAQDSSNIRFKVTKKVSTPSFVIDGIVDVLFHPFSAKAEAHH